jgi:hypothetical protein
MSHSTRSPRRTSAGFSLVAIGCAAITLVPSYSFACGFGGGGVQSPPAVGGMPGASESEAAAPAVQVITFDEPTRNEARPHFRAGMKAYKAGDYAAAVKEFKIAEAKSAAFDSTILVLQLAQTNEKLHRPSVALAYYNRYLEQNPMAPSAADIRNTISNLEREVAARGNGKPHVGEGPADMPPDNVGIWAGADPFDFSIPVAKASSGGGGGRVDSPRQKYWWVGLVVVGGVAAIVGATFGAVSASGAGGGGVVGASNALTIRF